MVCEVFRGQVFDGKEFHQKPVLSDEEAAKRPPVRVDPREKIQWNMVYDDTQKNVKLSIKKFFVFVFYFLIFWGTTRLAGLSFLFPDAKLWRP